MPKLHATPDVYTFFDYQGGGFICIDPDSQHHGRVFHSLPDLMIGYDRVTDHNSLPGANRSLIATRIVMPEDALAKSTKMVADNPGHGTDCMCECPDCHRLQKERPQ